MKRNTKEPLVSDEAHIIATQLVEMKRDISSVDSSIHSKLLAPLAAYRNQAIFLKQKDKKELIEQIISGLVLLPPPPKKKSTKAQESQQRKPERKIHKTIKVSPEERQYINKIIDLLLTDSEIDTIDPEFIPKMLIVLKERKQKAQLNADLATSRLIQQQMKKLEKMANSPDCNPQAKQKLIDNYIQIVNRVRQLTNEYQNKIKSTLEQKEEAKNKIIEANNKDVIAFEEERESLENGDGFLPSNTLRELYRKVKIVETFEEKQYLQKQIEEQENTEMYEYLQRTDRLMKNKKERLKKSFYSRKQIFEEQWESKQNKIKTHYDQLIAQEKLQLETMKKRLINAGIEPPQVKQEFSYENENESQNSISDPNLLKKTMKDDTNNSSILSNNQQNESKNYILDINGSPDESKYKQNESHSPEKTKQNESKINIHEQNKPNESKISIHDQAKPNESKISIHDQTNKSEIDLIQNSHPLSTDLTNNLITDIPNRKEKDNSNDKNQSKFKEMVMKIFGNETQIQDNYLDIDIDLNQDSDLIDLNEFHDETRNDKKENINILQNPINQDIKFNENMNSDLIFFSQEKEDTEVPFFTDDEAECSVIKVENNQSTSSIFDDNIFDPK